MEIVMDVRNTLLNSVSDIHDILHSLFENEPLWRSFNGHIRNNNFRRLEKAI